MEDKLDSQRQVEISSRLQYTRTLPFPVGTFGMEKSGRDFLMMAEPYLHGLPCIPLDGFAENLFKGVEAAALQLLASAHRCIEAQVHLTFLIDVLPEENLHLPSLRYAREVYALEAQRLFSVLFPLKDPFWTNYYNRLQAYLFTRIQMSDSTDPQLILQQVHRRLGIYLLSLDALHQLTAHHHVADYQLLLQSLRWALVAYYVPENTVGYHRREALQNALLLVDSVAVPEYRAWLQNQLAYKTFHPENPG